MVLVYAGVSVKNQQTSGAICVGQSMDKCDGFRFLGIQLGKKDLATMGPYDRYKWSWAPYKWPYKWVGGVMTWPLFQWSYGPPFITGFWDNLCRVQRCFAELSTTSWVEPTEKLGGFSRDNALDPKSKPKQSMGGLYIYLHLAYFNGKLVGKYPIVPWMLSKKVAVKSRQALFFLGGRLIWKFLMFLLTPCVDFLVGFLVGP